MTNNSSITAYMNNMNYTRGLTMIELMVTLAAVAILVAVGLPQMQGISKGSRLTAAINTLSADLAYARSEAVTRNVTVRITSTSGNDWTDGWIIEALPAAGLPVTLRNGPAIKTNTLLNGSAATLTFISDGTQTAGGEVTFKACKYGDGTAHGRELRVIATGRIKLVKDQGCP